MAVTTCCFIFDLACRLVDVSSLRLELRLPDSHAGGAAVAVLAAVVASVWLAANSAPIVWLLWFPVPALIAAATFGSEPAGRRVACLITGIVVCLAGMIFVLWGWFLYIPAGLILVVTSALPAHWR